MQGPLGQILDFLISTLIGLYIILLMLRVIFGIVRADFYNPLSQTIVQLTNPPLQFLRRFIPPAGRVDLAAIVLIVLLKFIELWLRLILFGVSVGPGIILLAAVRELLTLVVWIFIISLIVEVVMSWIQAGSGTRSQNPIGRLAADVNRPLLGPVRRMLPNTGMIDFSPMLVLIGLYIVLILVHSL